jgi:uncharacterized coiled-coil DUF342 family protein
VPGRVHLTEEDERAEADARERIRHAQSRLRELGDRRAVLLDQIHRLSDEQRQLHERMAPDQERVEGVHAEYRELGHLYGELRARRESLRAKLDEALMSLRPPRTEHARRAPPVARPEPIRQEMAALELEQQTQALPLAEENALIDRLRRMRRELEVAEKEEALRLKASAERETKEAGFRELRNEFESLGAELDRLKAERGRRMASMKSTLVEVGQEISQIREKARARAELFQQVEELNRKMAAVDREIREALTSSRARRQEARQTLAEYNRTAREAVSGSAVAAQAADEQFDQLMKGGRVTLGG